MGPTNYLLERLRDGDFSDCTLVCRGRKFNLHRVICSQSPVMHEELSEVESHPHVLNADNFEVVSIQRLVDYLYDGDYDPAVPVEKSAGFPEKRSDSVISENTRVHLEMSIVADHFKLPGLAKIASERVGHMLENYWRPHLFCDILLDFAKYSADRNMRDMILEMAVRKMPELAKEPKFEELKEIGPLGHKLLCQMASPLKAIKKQRGN
ncbi:unnamed protein product [Clonostachys rosea]|uniref:BTB domain-containing protein n=1 Tax=Bionectria ochroleuca TaxID=29856 RepID=A0ABY6UU31_BIOOC|nr:unnamed protein product [Clonostachys rosea]